MTTLTHGNIMQNEESTASYKNIYLFDSDCIRAKYRNCIRIAHGAHNNLGNSFFFFVNKVSNTQKCVASCAFIYCINIIKHVHKHKCSCTYILSNRLQYLWLHICRCVCVSVCVRKIAWLFLLFVISLCTMWWCTTLSGCHHIQWPFGLGFFLHHNVKWNVRRA